MAEESNRGQVVYLLYEGDADCTANWDIIFTSIDKANEWLYRYHKECLTFKKVFGLFDYETMNDTEYGSRFYLKEIVVNDI